MSICDVILDIHAEIQSESCGLSIPEIELVLQAGTLGGRFTTLEGILDQVYEELSQKLIAGDAADDSHSFETFLKKLKAVCCGHVIVYVTTLSQYLTGK